MNNYRAVQVITLAASASSAAGRILLTVQGLEVGVLVLQLRITEMAVWGFSFTTWSTSSRSFMTIPD